jgi:hypothetical protein
VKFVLEVAYFEFVWFFLRKNGDWSLAALIDRVLAGSTSPGTSVVVQIAMAWMAMDLRGRGDLLLTSELLRI